MLCRRCSLFGKIHGLHHLDVRIHYEVWESSPGILEDAKKRLLYHVMQSHSRMLESSTTISAAAKAVLISTKSEKGIATSLSAETADLPEENIKGGDTITKHSLSIWMELDSHDRTEKKPTKWVKISLKA